MAVSTDIIVRVTFRERSRLLAYIMVILKDEHAAEDILQDITLAAIRKSDEIAGEEHLMGWLRKAARFRALEIRRNRAAQATVLEPDVIELLEAHWERHDGDSTVDQIEALKKCVEQLSPHARKVLELRYVSNLTGQRLADQLGRKLSTAYVAVSRVHKALHDCLRLRLGAHHFVRRADDAAH